MAATPATRALEAAGVPFDTTEYDPPDDHHFGDALISSLGLDPARVGKTLVTRLDDGRAVVAVVPVAASLDLKALARAAGAKRAAMAEPHDAERLTGSTVGGIAPLGHRTRLAVYVDETLAATDTVHVSGGKRGLELTLAAEDLVRVCRATVAPIAR